MILLLFLESESCSVFLIPEKELESYDLDKLNGMDANRKGDDGDKIEELHNRLGLNKDYNNPDLKKYQDFDCPFTVNRVFHVSWCS